MLQNKECKGTLRSSRLTSSFKRLWGVDYTSFKLQTQNSIPDQGFFTLPCWFTSIRCLPLFLIEVFCFTLIICLSSLRVPYKSSEENTCMRFKNIKC